MQVRREIARKQGLRRAQYVPLMLGSLAAAGSVRHASFDREYYDPISFKAPEAAINTSDSLVVLKVMSGDDVMPQRTVTLPATIGRPTGTSGLSPSPHNCLFNNVLISRKHAIISMEGRALWVTDLGSSNGSYLNGILLKAHTPFRLNEGDLLQFGVEDDLLDVEKKGQPLVVLQVKIPAAPQIPQTNQIPQIISQKTVAAGRTFSPGRILQEARSMLSRSTASRAASTSSYDMPSYQHQHQHQHQQQQHHRYSLSASFARVQESRACFDLSSGLIALAQRLVEAAEGAKLEEVPNLEQLSDLSATFDYALRHYAESRYRQSAEDPSRTIHQRPNLAAAQNIIVRRIP